MIKVEGSRPSVKPDKSSSFINNAPGICPSEKDVALRASTNIALPESKTAFAVCRLIRGISGYGMLELGFTEEALEGVAEEERAREARSIFNDHHTDPATIAIATTNITTEFRYLLLNIGRSYLLIENHGQDDTITHLGYP
jgi:hypothetical protein